jgi:3-oxoacyl-[acyl-carrier-protein] synthase-3
MIISYAIGSKKINIFQKCKKKFGLKKTKQLISKTGPKNLFICNKLENTLSLSLLAWNNLKNKKKIIQNTQALYYVSESPVKKFPGNGFLFSSIINLKKNIQVLDINAGCTGFVDVLIMSLKLKRNAIIICSEAYSKNNLKFNRSISPLFSDGAAVFIPDLKKIKLLKQKVGFKRNSYEDLGCDYNKNIHMDGRKVFDFVSTSMLPELLKILKNRKNRIDRVYLHQGSHFVTQYIKKKIINYCKHIPENISLAGNFVSATIPILIKQDMKKKPLKKNENILLCGFGVGLSYNIALLNIRK